jgi:hypothetical protein
MFVYLILENLNQSFNKALILIIINFFIFIILLFKLFAFSKHLIINQS